MVQCRRMTYRLNTDRLVIFSVLLWALLPPGVFAWEGNPPGPDNVRWLEQFCSSYMQFLTMGGVLCVVIGFVCAALIWMVHRQNWGRSVKIGVLFFLSALILMLYGGSLSFALFFLPLALINPAVYCFSVSRMEQD